MSVFDTALDCTRGMIECLNQNYWTTPPYGPVPDATYKLRLAANAMLDALIIAMDAESRGQTMPPVPMQPEGETHALMAGHVVHRHGLAANTPERAETPAQQPYTPPANIVLP